MVCGYHIRFMCDGLPMSDIASCDSTVPFCFPRPTSADVGRPSADVGREKQKGTVESQLAVSDIGKPSHIKRMWYPHTIRFDIPSKIM